MYEASDRNRFLGPGQWCPEARRAGRSGLLPWTLLVLGSAASLAANVAVAEPSVVGRLIAAWPSCALIGAYELLMRQIRHISVRKIEGDNAEVGVISEAAHMTSENSRRLSAAAHGLSEKSHRGPRSAPAISEESLRSPACRSATSEKSHTDQVFGLRHSSAQFQRRDAVDGDQAQRSSSQLDRAGDVGIQKFASRPW